MSKFNPGDRVRVKPDGAGLYLRAGDEYVVDYHDTFVYLKDVSPNGFSAHRFELVEKPTMLEVGKTYKSKGGSPVTVVAQFDGDKFAAVYNNKLLRAYNREGIQFNYHDGSGNLKPKSWAGNIDLEVRKTRYIVLGTESGSYWKDKPDDKSNPALRLDYLNGQLVSATVLCGGKDSVDWSGGNG